VNINSSLEAAGLIETQSANFVTMAINASPVVHSDLKVLGGTPVFVGTRVPVESLFDWLRAGDPLEEFLANFPVNREQAQAALESACNALLAITRTT
jgi:uncharacterized protein (DUF433 family)